MCIRDSAYTQLTVRYRRDIPELFKYNAFVVISDGANNKYGSFSVSYTHLDVYKRQLRPMLRFWRYVRAVNEVRGGTSWQQEEGQIGRAHV